MHNFRKLALLAEKNLWHLETIFIDSGRNPVPESRSRSIGLYLSISGNSELMHLHQRSHRWLRIDPPKTPDSEPPSASLPPPVGRTSPSSPDSHDPPASAP